MSVVLYLLGAGLFAWSGYLMLSGETYAAIDIAAGLAGWGAFTIGLGAVVGAVGKLTRTIAERAASPADRASGIAASARKAVKAAVAEPDPAPRLSLRLPAAAEEPEALFEGPKAVRSGSARLTDEIEVRRDEEPGFEAARPMRSPLGTGEEPGRRAKLSPPPVALRVNRPRLERAPLVVPPPSVENDAITPEPFGASRLEREPIAEFERASDDEADLPDAPPVDAPAATEPELSESLEPAADAAPEPEAAPQPDPAPEPVADPDASPEPAEPEPPALVSEPKREPEPAAEAPPPERSAFAPPPASGAPAVPEWLARARARREARMEGGSTRPPEDPFRGPQEPSKPEAEPAEAAPPPSPDPPPAPQVTREGEHKGVLYRFYDDESVEAVSPHGTRRFASVEDLRATVIAARGGDAFDDDPSALSADDQLDAALAELEGAPAEPPPPPRDRVESSGAS